MNAVESLVYQIPKNECECSENFFIIFNSFSYCTDIQVSKQSFIDFVNDLGQIFEIRKFSSIGRLTYCYCPESGGAIPFAYRCLKD